MATQPTFNEALEKNLKTLTQYVPVVARVHGSTHPEFFDVKKSFDAIHEKIKNTNSVRPELTEEFSKLRETTNNYTVPGDVCESYEAVFKMLAELDEAYHN